MRKMTSWRIWSGTITSIFLLFVLAAASVWAQKVETGYDKSADFSRFGGTPGSTRLVSGPGFSEAVKRVESIWLQPLPPRLPSSRRV